MKTDEGTGLLVQHVDAPGSSFKFEKSDIKLEVLFLLEAHFFIHPVSGFLNIQDSLNLNFLVHGTVVKM